MADVKSDRRQALDLAIASIDRQFGKGAIMRLGQSGALDEIASSRPAPCRSTPRSASAASRAAVSPRSTARSRRARPRSRSTSSPRRSAGRHRGLHRRRARARSHLREEPRREHRRAPDLPARHRRAGARDRRDAGALQCGRRHRDRLGGGARAARRARRRHGRLAPGAAGAPHVPGAAQAHRGHLALRRQRDLHQPDPREDRRHVRVLFIHHPRDPGRWPKREDRQDRQPAAAGRGALLRPDDRHDRATPRRQLVRQWPRPITSSSSRSREVAPAAAASRPPTITSSSRRAGRSGRGVSTSAARCWSPFETTV